MASFPYDKDFLPVVHEGDYVRFLPLENYKGVVYKIAQVEAMQPWVLDYLQIPGALPAGVHSLAAVGSTNDKTNDLANTSLINYFATEEGIFTQWRADPIVDILLKFGGNSPFFSRQYVATYIGKRVPSHRANAKISTAPGTDTLLWTNTVGSRIGGEATGNTPNRKSRIIGIAADVAGAVNIRFGDADVGAGTAADSTHYLFQIVFATADSIFLGKDSLPQNLYFEDGVVAQLSAAVGANITVIVEEDAEGIFGGNLLEESRANATQAHEFYTWENEIPVMTILNPLAVSQSTARVTLAGFLFGIIEVPAVPAGAKVTGIPLQRIRR